VKLDIKTLLPGILIGLAIAIFTPVGAKIKELLGR